jgi:hypothetical protein
MAYANILIGDLPNDGTGDPLRVAFGKINNNFANLQTLYDPDGPVGSYQFKSTTTIDGVSSNSYTGSNALVNDGSNVLLGTNLIPNGIVDIGSVNNPVQNIYVGSSAKIGNVTLTGTGDTISFSANINPVNINVSNTLSFGTTVIVNNNAFFATTPNNAANQNVYSFPLAQTRTVRFEITTVQPTTQNSQFAVVEATKQNNNTDIKYVVHSTIFVGTVLTNYSVSAENGQLKLNLSPFVNATLEHSVVVKINT